MITEKETIKCEAVYDDTRQHRLLLKRIWSKEKPLACVITIHPCLSDNIAMDATTRLILNNIASLESYGGVSIVNLFTLLTPKLQMRWARDIDINDPENDNYIKKAAAEASTIILAWGRGANMNARINHRAEQVVQLFRGQEEKLKVISDGERTGLHPLTPSCRHSWILEDYVPIPTNDSKTEEAPT
jgi:hypothetical protein